MQVTENNDLAFWKGIYFWVWSSLFILKKYLQLQLHDNHASSLSLWTVQPPSMISIHDHVLPLVFPSRQIASYCWSHIVTCFYFLFIAAILFIAARRIDTTSCYSSNLQCGKAVHEGLCWWPVTSGWAVTRTWPSTWRRRRRFPKNGFFSPQCGECDLSESRFFDQFFGGLV
jgi:hypothetical protein